MNKVGLMKNKLAEKDQVRMVVRNASPNLVERLQVMNPKSFYRRRGLARAQVYSDRDTI